MKFSLRGTDTVFLTLVVVLTLGGFLIFTSASLGLLAREHIALESVLLKQFFFGVVIGFCALWCMSMVSYRFFARYAFSIYAATLACALLAFVPQLAFEHGGAQRWIDIFGFSLQPSEFLKIGFMLAVARWFSMRRPSFIRNEWQLILGFFVISLPVVVVMFLQRDTDGLLVLVSGAFAIAFASGILWRYIGVLVASAAAMFGTIIAIRPYLIERLMTYFSNTDTLGAGWQIEQSKIAIGSGELFGRGFGQSIQKFGLLPEPTTDSIFAVFSEEWGFVGAVALLVIFFLFMLRGYRIATLTRNKFSCLLVVGIVTTIMIQVSINIAAVTGVFAFAGLTLPLVSHGGTSLLVTLSALGIVLSVSRQIPKQKHIKHRVFRSR